MDTVAAETIDSDDSQDKNSLSYLKGFFGLFSFVVFLLLIFLGATMQPGSFLPGEFPEAALLALFIVIALVCLRWQIKVFASARGLTILKTISVIGTCAAPLFLIVPVLQLFGLVVMAAGIASVTLLWCLYFCRFSQTLLAALISIAAISASVVAGLILAYGLPPWLIVGLAGTMAVISALIICIDKSFTSIPGLTISAEDSAKRASTVRHDRWTYSAIGLDLGLGLGLAHAIVAPSAAADYLGDLGTALEICVPLAAAGIAILGCQLRPDHEIEARSKDYLAFAVALFALPVPFAPPLLQDALIACLLAVGYFQALIVIIASIGFIRFGELSPLWYMGEEAFIAGGITAGLSLAWLGGLSLGEGALLPLCLFVAVLANIFAQIRISHGSFPTAELFKALNEPPKPAFIPTVNLTDPHAFDDDEIMRGGIWKSKVAYVCEKYELSPRQREILDLLAKGRDARYIEEYFCISRSTTKSHIYNIYNKLDIHSRQELLDVIENAPVYSGAEGEPDEDPSADATKG